MMDRKDHRATKRVQDHDDAEDEKLRSYLGIPDRFRVFVDTPVTEEDVQRACSNGFEILVLLAGRRDERHAILWSEENVHPSTNVTVAWTSGSSPYTLRFGCLERMTGSGTYRIFQGDYLRVPASRWKGVVLCQV